MAGPGPKQFTRVVSCRFTPEQDDWLQTEAKRRGMARAELVRLYVDQRMQAALRREAKRGG